jgi:uncharacterized protein
MKLLFASILIVSSLAAQETASVTPEELKAHAVEQEAKGGAAPAMAELGKIYLEGKGRPKDLAQARDWFQKGAAAGNASAQVGLGYMLSRGLGDRTDYPKAGHWFQLAAEQNDVKGQHNLARLLFDGRLGPNRKAEALKWFIKAADQGYVESQATLGSKYFFMQDGFGQNYETAIGWLEKAAAQGHTTSRTTLATMLRHGQGKAADPERALQLYEASVREDDSNAMCLLGDMLAEPGKAWRNPARAHALFTAGGRKGIAGGLSRAAELETSLQPAEKASAEKLLQELLKAGK